MRTLHTISILIIFSVLSGCGLLVIPNKVSIPDKSLQTIIVVDQETKKPITDALVLCEMYEYKNWIKPLPSWDCTNSTNGSRIHVVESPDQKVWSWQAKTHGQGIFVLEPKNKIGWTQIWFPLPLPNGWFLYRTYDFRIIVSSPSYNTLWISNVAIDNQPRYIDGPNNLDPHKLFTIEDNKITIMLPREILPHNQGLQTDAAEPRR